MPQMTIYVSHELREQLRQAQLPISEICQKALRAELRKTRGRRHLDDGATTPQPTIRRP